MSKAFFAEVDSKVNFPRLEEEISKYWKQNRIFEKSVESRPMAKTWTFLDGPPFITGLPHYGTLLVSIPKDIFPRFWTMKGYRVRRVWGWDVHGLPAENKVETKLGITRKKDIEEKIGVKKFIQECREYVKETSEEWEWYIDHIGRWVDFKNAYKTLDLSYMESVMWVFKQMYDKGYIYKGLRVSLYCPHCATPISNFEVAMDADNYKDVVESTSIYKYKLFDQENTYFLAWSTTPWNKLVTPALAVNPKLKYVEVNQNNENYILASDTLPILKTKKYKVVKEYSGLELIGKKFIPHYDFYKIDPGKKAFVVIPGDFVTSAEGTGIVTIAAYGEEDLKVMQAENIQVVLHVNEEGIIFKDSPIGAGMFYLDANSLVNKDLAERGLIYKEEQHSHSIPTCWRCHTRLFYAPQDAWYVNIQKLKPLMKKTNKTVNWFPSHFKLGRFLKSLEAAPDWCISRSRYWGSPVPVWECSCGQRYIPSSIAELEKLSGKKISDLHKPEIDQVVIKCKNCGQLAKRVPEVLDSWIEAGSASLAERHYPFQKGLELSQFFPPDFIVEYTGQIRAWFYVLHVISAALFESNAFKNVVVTGVILGTDGRKMSKNYGNYPDPKEMLTKYGGDALRLYLMGSPVMKGEDIIISETGYRNKVKEFILIFWNIYNFFVTYANLDNWQPRNKTDVNISEDNLSVLDKWIIVKLTKLTELVSSLLEIYNTNLALAALEEFVVKDLSQWYVRRSRERVGNNSVDREDKHRFYTTLYFVLVNLTKLLAPFVPFISEVVYRNLTKEESVHLSTWPNFKSKDIKINEGLIADMNLVRLLAEKGHALRKAKAIVVRQPLSQIEIEGIARNLDKYAYLLLAELNVKSFKQKISSKAKLRVKLDTKMTPELEEEAKTRELLRKIQEKRKDMKVNLKSKIILYNDWFPKDQQLIDFLKKKTLTQKFEIGEFRVQELK